MGLGCTAPASLEPELETLMRTHGFNADSLQPFVISCACRLFLEEKDAGEAGCGRCNKFRTALRCIAAYTTWGLTGIIKGPPTDDTSWRQLLGCKAAALTAFDREGPLSLVDTKSDKPSTGKWSKL